MNVPVLVQGLLVLVLISGAVATTLLLEESSNRPNYWRWCDKPLREPYCGFVKEEYQSGDVDGLVYLLTPRADRSFSTFFPSAAMILAEFERLHPELRILEFSATEVAGGYRLRVSRARSG